MAAQADLQEIVDFISADSPVAAENWLQAMYAKFKEIERHPLSARKLIVLCVVIARPQRDRGNPIVS
jgi:plasmid stabilization system protein ParE